MVSRNSEATVLLSKSVGLGDPAASDEPHYRKHFSIKSQPLFTLASADQDFDCAKKNCRRDLRNSSHHRLTSHPRILPPNSPGCKSLKKHIFQRPELLTAPLILKKRIETHLRPLFASRPPTFAHLIGPGREKSFPWPLVQDAAGVASHCAAFINGRDACMSRLLTE